MKDNLARIRRLGRALSWVAGAGIASLVWAAGRLLFSWTAPLLLSALDDRPGYELLISVTGQEIMPFVYSAVIILISHLLSLMKEYYEELRLTV